MSGAVGGGGIGKIAISHGYLRFNTIIMFLAVIVLVIIVQIFQSLGTLISTRLDKRVKK